MVNLIENGKNAKYSWKLKELYDKLLLESSYALKFSEDEEIYVLSEEESDFIVDRLKEVMQDIVPLFGDAIIPDDYFDNSFILNDGFGFTINVENRIISELPIDLERLGTKIFSYVETYLLFEWQKLKNIELKSENLRFESVDELADFINKKLSFKVEQSFSVKKV
ncbi:MAG: hypothetical protein IMY73_01750 [Bacteroidetes bacterium]|nr:hypothetical protein [Bacteroidota bacterium]